MSERREFLITLRAARVNCGMTLKEVGDVTSRHPETISKYEIDSTSIPRDLMEELVALYGVPRGVIFFGKESVFTGSKKEKSKTA